MSTQSTPHGTNTNGRPEHLTAVNAASGVVGLADWQVDALQKLTLQAPLLITDDDAMSRTFYRTLLADTIGLTLVETCHKQPISLIISCILKPLSKDGFDLAVELRADPQTRQIPLLIITATMHTRELALQAGANAYLNKPCHPNEILQTIWHLLRDRAL